MKAQEAAKSLRKKLTAAGIQDPAFESELLTRYAGKLTRSQFYAGAILPAKHLNTLKELGQRRLQNEPTAYILGMREFYGLEFKVGPGVLIPRPETELLVELVKKEINENDTVIEVGTGSGCIAIALAIHIPKNNLVATDVSSSALKQAYENTLRHKVDIPLVKSYLATSIANADIVIANLPYIPTHEIDNLPAEIKKWEPLEALDGGGTGTELIERLADDCNKRLKPRVLALEIGFGQAQAISGLLESYGASVEINHDLAGIERVVLGRWKQ